MVFARSEEFGRCSVCSPPMLHYFGGLAVIFLRSEAVDSLFFCHSLCLCLESAKIRQSLMNSDLSVLPGATSFYKSKTVLETLQIVSFY